jgi:hypothetical protein
MDGCEATRKQHHRDIRWSSPHCDDGYYELQYELKKSLLTGPEQEFGDICCYNEICCSSCGICWDERVRIRIVVAEMVTAVKAFG